MENYKFIVDKSKNSFHIPYLFEEQNYIFKLNTDLSFLEFTILNKYFYFSNKNDPFLLNLTVSLGEDSQRIV
jgi:hypothetical protein